MKSLLNHPKQIIIISLVIAAIIGVYGYQKINKYIPTPVIQDNTNADVIEGGSNPSMPQDISLGFLAGGRINSISVKAGDKVVKGQVLATLDAGNTQGALAQAQAAYESAKASYQKIINGATSSAIDVAKAAVNSAQVNLSGVTEQQKLLVANAYANLLNSTIVAKSNTDVSLPAPSITGTYAGSTEGTINLVINQGGQSGYFSISGIVNGTGIVSTTTPEPILSTGLYVEFPTGTSYLGTTWNIPIPNNTAPNYLANYNAYQSALQTQTQAVSNAQATLDQANASLDALVTAARPEDVAAAQAQMDNAEGAVQIAQAAYENTIITAPDNGTVVSVAITPGQIATPNSPAIDFTSDSSITNN
ncbi:MAG: biotin/lipoyl-binding protein [Candidatus Pacebacteria bacterium]|nr:biotin/lipoyl-binding protein [Candidatus Paceibacterota bacterium]